MLKHLTERISRRQLGFTLVEVMAAVVILSVIGLSVLNVSGKGQILLARQNNEMESRISARAVLTRMVKEIEEAKSTTVQDPSTILIVDKAGKVKTYGFDSAKSQVYLKDNETGNITYIIPAISMAFFTPVAEQGKVYDYVNMDIRVKVGSSEMTFSATATSRSVNTNSSPVPRITMVAPPKVTFDGTEKIEDDHGDGNDRNIGESNAKDDDDDTRDDVPGNGKQTIHISAAETNFNTNTFVVLVPQGATLDLTNFTNNVVYKNNGIDKIVRTDNTKTEIYFELKQTDVTTNTYDVWAITPNIPKSGLYEKAFRLASLTVNNDTHAKNPEDDDQDYDKKDDGQHYEPDNDSWNNHDDSNESDDDWKVDRGNIPGFGSINYGTKEIVKKENSNDKILYYNHKVAEFDYEARVQITDQNSTDAGKLALLTLNYNGLNNTNGGGGWYVGFGINQTGVYYGEKGSVYKLTLPSGVSVTNGEAVLRAVKQKIDGKYWLTLYVNGTVVLKTDKVPSGTGYLGVTVTDNKVKAKFTVTRNP